ncbi:class I SAM-dependent methyltransferase [Capnocytophaga cynodegmi]|uniref:class I SAM-dependent methyltransferase n=1 Tax=Capnocytophaga cynodegmi TaxID=28189 RepID=UPI001AC45249|nr:class I SAM-dependent methyltransferase [Capnocytophaga cynodegmi]GIM54221.1 methyltransferase [Capnocytophaga cynodegmi]
MDSNIWIEKWNNHYKTDDFVYGKSPNRFFKEEIDRLRPLSILLPAEGEGRNAVYAAKNHWQVTAFDISEEGKKKALQLAKENDVFVNYKVGELPNLDFDKASFDAIALIYAHFPPQIRSAYHQKLITLLKKGGIVIFEGFGKKHLDYRKKNPKIGGPADAESLFSLEEIQSDFADFEFETLVEQEVALSEGLLHNGIGSVIRFVARKQ